MKSETYRFSLTAISARSGLLHPLAAQTLANQATDRNGAEADHHLWAAQCALFGSSDRHARDDGAPAIS